MAIIEKPPSLSVLPDKKSRLFRMLSEIEFSGRITWKDNSKQQWTFFYVKGNLMYATGGEHPLRRWKRSLQQQAIHKEISLEQLNISDSPKNNLDLVDQREYMEIWAAMRSGKLTQEQAICVIQEISKEVLLDLRLSNGATFTIVEREFNSPHSPLIDLNQASVFEETFSLWKKWIELGFNTYHPNQAPVIRQAERIRERTNEQLYGVLVTLLNGQNTLRDIAVKMGRDIVQITQALNSFIQLDWVEFIDVSDASPARIGNSSKPVQSSSRKKRTLVACVDDSPFVCQSMEQIVTANGYEFISVLDPLRALILLLSKKPDIIFLDLVMPHTNGYEICTRLRRATLFKTTPIVILSGNDTVIDQVRARLIGATDFVSKPVNSDIILSKIQQHLPTSAPIYP